MNFFVYFINVKGISWIIIEIIYVGIIVDWYNIIVF